eukprot:m.78553 g.78553  ORF g.78553 m.78553 type:complete len:582 (+) comp14589_c0_seq1:545-2290(+)
MADTRTDKGLAACLAAPEATDADARAPPATLATAPAAANVTVYLASATLTTIANITNTDALDVPAVVPPAVVPGAASATDAASSPPSASCFQPSNVPLASAASTEHSDTAVASVSVPPGKATVAFATATTAGEAASADAFATAGAATAADAFATATAATVDATAAACAAATPDTVDTGPTDATGCLKNKFPKHVKPRATPDLLAATRAAVAAAAVDGGGIDINALLWRLLSTPLDPRHLGRALLVTEAEVFGLVNLALPLFNAEPALLELDTPLAIFGDVYACGNVLQDLLGRCGLPTGRAYFKQHPDTATAAAVTTAKGTAPETSTLPAPDVSAPTTPMLFLGNYVDKGKQNIHTLCLLLALKIKFPSKIHLLRGNHECASICRIYGFYDECKRSFSVRTYQQVTPVFDALPIAAVVGQSLLCLHGGLSPEPQGERLETLRQISRPCDVPDYGLLTDCLWSQFDSQMVGWNDNDCRGVSFRYGPDIARDWLVKNNLGAIVCSQHMTTEGIESTTVSDEGHRVIIVNSNDTALDWDDDACVGMVFVDEQCDCILRQKKYKQHGSEDQDEVFTPPSLRLPPK